MKPQTLLDQIDDSEIIIAIRKAEQTTSGEIRVFITRKNVEDPLERAKQQFQILGMATTAEKNGILLLVAPKSQKMAIFAGEGIYPHYPPAVWQGVVDSAIATIQADPTAALCAAVAKIGEILKETFPYQKDDVNELDDDVIRD